MKIFLVFLMVFAFCENSLAVTVTIIDNGVYTGHPDLIKHEWNNTSERRNNRDDDRNGYIDDLYGWNFAQDNNDIFDDSLLHNAQRDIYKYYNIKVKRSYGTMTKKEEAWLKKIDDDEDFDERISRFVKMTHGTHVAGITVRENVTNLPIKILPIRYLGKSGDGEEDHIPLTRTETQRIKALKSVILAWKRDIRVRLTKTIKYASRYSNVMNLSFGSSFKSYRKKVSSLYKKIWKKSPSEEVAKKWTNYYIRQINLSIKSQMKKYPHILFVMSAGNAKMDNDEFFHYPSNIRLPNTMAVAASLERTELANFTNWGAETVDVAAPGVGIKSLSPGNPDIRINGTSQATPYVTNVAANLFNIAKKYGKKISAAKVREIIMDTVDKRKSMVGKIKSAGIVSPERAYRKLRVLMDSNRL